MARTWLQVRVEILGGRGELLEHPPGRVFLVGPSHTFAQLADAINTAFARWDLSHLHEFELARDRRIGFVDSELVEEGATEDHEAVAVSSAVQPGEAFAYIFDLGDYWEHHCRVLDEKLDPRDEFDGPPPGHPLAIWGWGSIPDQYGRETADELELDS